MRAARISSPTAAPPRTSAWSPRCTRCAARSSDLHEGTQLSDIHMLALEASAIDYDYSDDRGLGAATGGSKERINAGLTQMLLREVQELAERAAPRAGARALPAAARGVPFARRLRHALDVRAQRARRESAPAGEARRLDPAAGCAARTGGPGSKREVMVLTARVVRSRATRSARARRASIPIRRTRRTRTTRWAGRWNAARRALDLRSRRPAPSRCADA